MAVRVHKTYNLDRMGRAIPKQMAQSINQIARLLLVDMKDGLERGLDVNNRRFIPLKDATIRSKKGPSPASPLIDTRTYLEGIHIKKNATPTSLKAVVMPPIGRGKARSGQRSIIIGYHNRGEGNLPVRKSFYEPERDKMPRVRGKIDRFLEQAGTKIVKSA